MRIHFEHCGPDSLRLGVVVAQGVEPEAPPGELENLLNSRLGALSAGLNPNQDAYRADVRDVFRNGRYKPTGRGKPASEYLLKAASEDRFPRINTLVDICNYLSVASLLPISIWDMEKAGSVAGWTDGSDLRFEFRLGAVDEQYVFNAGGQEIGLEDLIVGTVASTGHSTVPIVNAVKDCQQTKTTTATGQVAAAIYAPRHDGPDLSLQAVCDSFLTLLTETGPSCRCAAAIIEPGKSASLSP